MNAGLTMLDASLLPPLGDEVRGLALHFVPAASRARVHALWALDEALAQVVRTTTQPMIGQMRLTWWHERLMQLDTAPPPAEPILTTLHPTGHGAALAGLVEGWEMLLEPLPLDAGALATHAALRGETLFAATARMIGFAPGPEGAGRGWAASDLARHCSDPATTAAAHRLAQVALAGATTPAPKALRILARVAMRDAQRPAGRPRPRSDILRAVLF